MKQLRFFVIALFATAFLPACHEKTETEETPKQDSVVINDSLATAQAEIDSLMALVNDINEGMNELKQMQDIVSSQDLSLETPDKKQRIKADMELIKQAVAQRQKRLAELEKRLNQSTHYTDEMKKTISSLKQQLEDQQTTINDLTRQLERAHIEISNLNTRVDSLNTVNEEVKQEKVRAQEESVRLENELNVCYYVIGTKKELKKNRIIETGFLRKTKIMPDDFERSYFTKADKRTLNSINLNSNKAQVLSKHPASSYEIVDNGKTKILRILHQDKFWELSNYLIIKVD